jgi:hypothetical protein
MEIKVGQVFKRDRYYGATAEVLCILYGYKEKQYIEYREIINNKEVAINICGVQDFLLRYNVS